MNTQTTQSVKYIKKKIPQALRNSVWVTYMGKVYIGKCFCCGTEEISHANFACGHVQSEKNGGSTSLENLRPVCVSCNSSMGTIDMEEFKKTFGLNQKTAELDAKESQRITRDGISPITIKPKKKQTESFNKFLMAMHLKHLKLFCHWLGLPFNKRKKDDIIQDIMKNITLRKLKKYIDISKKYFVTCHNKINSVPHVCKFKVSLKTIKCTICGRHDYFTDTYVRECTKCKNMNMKCSNNIFCKFIIPHVLSTHKNRSAICKKRSQVVPRKNINVSLRELTKSQLIFLCAICLGYRVSSSKNKNVILKEIIRHKIKYTLMRQRIDTTHKYLLEKNFVNPRDACGQCCKLVKSNGIIVCKKCCKTLTYTNTNNKNYVTYMNPFYIHEKDDK
jgi:hypothetical protein